MIIIILSKNIVRTFPLSALIDPHAQRIILCCNISVRGDIHAKNGRYLQSHNIIVNRFEGTIIIHSHKICVMSITICLIILFLIICTWLGLRRSWSTKF